MLLTISCTMDSQKGNNATQHRSAVDLQEHAVI